MVAGSKSTSGAAGNAPSRLPTLVQALCDSSLYDHPVDTIRVVETHISYIVLTGPYAYKIKKPVKLSFLDFSTVEQRKFYCLEELRLNQRFAPDLYLAVIAVTGSETAPELNGRGKTIDYVLKMVQFDSSQELDTVLKNGGIDPELVQVLAENLAGFHQSAASSNAQNVGSFELVEESIKDNFIETAPCVTTSTLSVFNALEKWVTGQLDAHKDSISSRKKDGFVRECHGDLHLGNMVIIEGRVRLFDCLEFNEQLRWIDVISEIAFLMMDFHRHERSDLAFCFLNRYLMVTGDYAGLELLPLYVIYRAMVRAKVDCIRTLQSRDQTDGESLLTYLKLAQCYTRLPTARLFITHGVSGSGKSWISERVSNLLPAIHIRSDVERLRPGRPGVVDGSVTDTGIRYSAENIARNYDELLRLATDILNAGFSVVVDATFLQSEQRERFRQLAVNMGTPFTILDFQCAEKELRKRVKQRKLAGKDPSEASVEVLETQLRHAQPLDTTERDSSVLIQTDRSLDISALAERILNSVV